MSRARPDLRPGLLPPSLESFLSSTPTHPHIPEAIIHWQAHASSWLFPPPPRNFVYPAHIFRKTKEKPRSDMPVMRHLTSGEHPAEGPRASCCASQQDIGYTWQVRYEERLAEPILEKGSLQPISMHSKYGFPRNLLCFLGHRTRKNIHHFPLLFISSIAVPQ